jgi:hypothetical protein
MSKAWETQAVILGKIIHKLFQQYPELEPLETSFVNFARSRGINPRGRRTLPDMIMVEPSAYDVLLKIISRQNEEIEALELRIKRLLEV